MRHTSRYLLLFALLISLSACGGMPKLFWSNDEGGGDTPAYARGGPTASEEVATRAPLELPPELNDELQLPTAEDVDLKTSAGPLPEQYDRVVSGKPVALTARLYNIKPGQVLSAVVDALTQLSLPVNSVDSPTGIITTDWVREGDSDAMDSIMGAVGVSTVRVIRYRLIVRVFRMKEGSRHQSRLEIRVLSQAYQNNHWVNKRTLAKRNQDLFSAVEEQIGRIRPQATPAESDGGLQP